MPLTYPLPLRSVVRILFYPFAVAQWQQERLVDGSHRRRHTVYEGHDSVSQKRKLIIIIASFGCTFFATYHDIASNLMDYDDLLHGSTV